MNEEFLLKKKYRDREGYLCDAKISSIFYQKEKKRLLKENRRIRKYLTIQEQREIK